VRYLVLGGSGFIGSHLSEALLADGNEVTVFDRGASPYLANLKEAGVRLFAGNFLNPNDLSRAMSGCDVIYHLISATVPQTSNDDPIYDVEANIIGTLRLLDEARKAQVKKIVFVSSGGTVYGIPREIPIKENHPTEPTSSYGISKLAIEKYLHLYWTLHGLDYCILRVSNAYGKRLPTTGPQGVIGAFLNKALRQDEIIIWGDGSIIRDYIYVDDIVNALVKAATQTGEHKLFNIGAGQGHSLNNIISIIEQIIQHPLQKEYTQDRVFDIPVNILDISRAKTCLNWQPMTGLLEGISHTFEWMLKDQTK
jgi:UDP-glucose 4-epimerase